VTSVLSLLNEGLVLAAAHITGGGLIENVPRVLPKGMTAIIDAHKWPVLPVHKDVFDIIAVIVLL
jgi:phosphoribosylaminoimidazole (AIR) synthetase